jgi:hypothetical protein
MIYPRERYLWGGKFVPGQMYLNHDAHVKAFTVWDRHRRFADATRRLGEELKRQGVAVSQPSA